MGTTMLTMPDCRMSARQHDHAYGLAVEQHGLDARSCRGYHGVDVSFQAGYQAHFFFAPTFRFLSTNRYSLCGSCAQCIINSGSLTSLEQFVAVYILGKELLASNATLRIAGAGAAAGVEPGLSGQRAELDTCHWRSYHSIRHL